MVVTVNNHYKTTITSIPRDYYVEMAGTNGEYNKINAAHVFGGADMQNKTVENVFCTSQSITFQLIWML